MATSDRHAKLMQDFRADVRRAEVAREFASHQDEDDGDTWIASHALYLAPWRDKDGKGRLGPWYGPQSAAQYANAMTEYLEGRAGGGCWDHEVADSMGPQRVVVKRILMDAREDELEDAERWYEAHSHELTPKRRAVFLGYWRDMAGYTVIAKRLNMSRTAVRQVVTEMRAAFGGAK